MNRMLNTSKEPKLIADGRPFVTKGTAPPEPERKAIRFTIEEIERRAKTVSPLLKEFLGLRPPPHWGINE